jgi:hypothetical protein
MFIGIVTRKSNNLGETTYDFTVLQQSSNITLTPITGAINIKVTQPSTPTYYSYYVTEIALN